LNENQPGRSSSMIVTVATLPLAASRAFATALSWTSPPDRYA
jgi:hypothetical protein